MQDSQPTQHTCEVQGGALLVLPQAAGALRLPCGDDSVALEAVVVRLPGGPPPDAQLVAAARLPCVASHACIICTECCTCMT